MKNLIVCSMSMMLISLSCQSFSLFQEEPVFMGEITIEAMPSPCLNFKVFRSFSNATTNESIQLRCNKGDNSYVFENYDGYLGYIQNANQLKLILTDSLANEVKVDTVVVAF